MPAIDPTLTPESPFPKRFVAYMAERFPLSVNGPAILLMFSSAYLVAARYSPEAPGVLSGRVALGMLVLFFFFLRLRISDEHKDMAYDRKVNPDRLVVRGVIGLGELKVVAGFGLVVELAASWVLGLEVFAAYAAAALWSVLMHLEFFCAEWLRARPGIYMASHMTVVPLLTFFCFMCASPPGLLAGSGSLIAFAAASVLATASLETARKIRLPDEEAPGVDTYSSAWGLGLSLGVAVAMQLVSWLILLALAGGLNLGPVFLGVSFVGFLAVALQLARYGMQKDRRLSGKLDKVAALYFLVMHIGLTASLWR